MIQHTNVTISHLHNHIHHPLISLCSAEIHHGAVTVTSPDRAIGILYQVALLSALLEVVMMVGGPSLRYVTEHTVNICQCLDTHGPEIGYEVSPVGIMDAVDL